MKRQQIVLDTTTILQRYLLGEISDKDKSIVEEKLATDKDFRNDLSKAEEALIMTYAYRGLSETNRRLFENNFLCTDERKQKLKFLENYDTISIPTLTSKAKLFYWFRNRYTPARSLVFGLSVIVISVTLFYGWDILELKRAERALVAAYSIERPTEARLTGFHYAKYLSTRSNQPIQFNKPNDRRALRLLINQDQGYESSTSALKLLGKWEITRREYDVAIGYFKHAIERNGTDAKAHNDIAVALMEQEKSKPAGEITGEGYAEALPYLHKAVELDPNLLEANFNLALCRQYMMLWRQAALDWKKYLEKDSASEWANEARKNLSKIEELIKNTSGNKDKLLREFEEGYRKRDADQVWQVFKNSRNILGSSILNKVIDDYLLAKLTNASEADEKLEELLFIGNVDLENTGDRYTYDIAKYYQTVTPQHIQKLLEARNLLKSAFELFQKPSIEETINKSKQAQSIFKSIGNDAEALTAQHLFGHCYFVHKNTKLSLEILTDGLHESERRSYFWLVGTYHNGLRNVYASLTKYSDALNHNRSLIENAKRVENGYGIHRGLFGLSEIYQLLGRTRESLLAIQEGLELTPKINLVPNNYLLFYTFAAKNYLSIGNLVASLDYQRENLLLSMEIQHLDAIARSNLDMSIIFSRFNKHSTALEHVRKAIEICNTIKDRKLNEILLTKAYLCFGEIYRDMGELEKSTESYKAVEQFYSASDTEYPIWLFEARKGRLLTDMRRGLGPSVDILLKQVIATYEEHRNNILDDLSRIRFFEKQQSIYDIAIQYTYFIKHDDRSAFNYSEMSRARSLLDMVELSEKRLVDVQIPNMHISSSSTPLNLAQIQERLPNKTLLLQYSLLDKNLIIWIITKNRLISRSVEISQRELNNKISDYLLQLNLNWKSPQNISYKQKANDLYNLLIKPVESDIQEGYEICIIPDKSLHRLPFASLISPLTNRYLIEDRVIYMSPSANMFIATTEKSQQKTLTRKERLLAVGPSQVNSLYYAESQIKESAELYYSRMVVLGNDSRESYVKKQLQQADVADFAMHYVADARTPMLSFLPLAKEIGRSSGDNDGKLQTFELYYLNLSRLRLAVLSACQTGIETYYDGEGPVGLARAFQAIGVPLVVASLWPVEDYPTKEMMLSFHKYRKSSGASSAKALRLAQLDMIKNNNPLVRIPYHWAAYTLYGGHSSF